MTLSTRRTLAMIWIALHAAVSICGFGLHSVPGLGHQKPTFNPRKFDARPAWSESRANSPDNCPICDHFTQSQIPAKTTTIAADLFAVFFRPDRPPLTAPWSPLAPARSRGPPLDAIRSV